MPIKNIDNKTEIINASPAQESSVNKADIEKLINHLRKVPLTAKQMEKAFEKFNNPQLWLSFHEEIHGCVLGYLNMGLPKKSVGSRINEKTKEIETIEYFTKDHRAQKTAALRVLPNFIAKFSDRLTDEEKIKIYVKNDGRLLANKAGTIFRDAEFFMGSEKLVQFFMPYILDKICTEIYDSGFRHLNRIDEDMKQDELIEFIKKHRHPLAKELKELIRYANRDDEEGVSESSQRSILLTDDEKVVGNAVKKTLLYNSVMNYYRYNKPMEDKAGEECVIPDLLLEDSAQKDISMASIHKASASILGLIFRLYIEDALMLDDLKELVRISWEDVRKSRGSELYSSAIICKNNSKSIVNDFLTDQDFSSKIMRDFDDFEEFFSLICDATGLSCASLFDKEIQERDPSALSEMHQTKERYGKLLGEAFKDNKDRKLLNRIVESNGGAFKENERKKKNQLI